MTPRWILVLCLVCLITTVSCSGKRPPNPGSAANGLAACPDSPNCVSSDAWEADHIVDPFVLSVPPEQAWPVLVEEVEKIPRTTIVEQRYGDLHAECRSMIFRFVDDLEFELRPAEGAIAVRSASRVGYSDWGVNRKRVEALREKLRVRGVIE